MLRSTCAQEATPAHQLDLERNLALADVVHPAGALDRLADGRPRTEELDVRDPVREHDRPVREHQVRPGGHELHAAVDQGAGRRQGPEQPARMAVPIACTATAARNLGRET